MTARCVDCGQVWQVSIYTDLRRPYVCPRCADKRRSPQAQKEAQKKRPEKGRMS